MKRETVFSIFIWVCRLGLGGVFIYSAVWKVQDPAIFADAVARYEILPESIVGLFALVMPMGELLSGIAIAFTPWRREGAFCILVLLAMFLVALAQAAVRGLDISCGCFEHESASGLAGILIAMARDVVMAGAALFVLLYGTRARKYRLQAPTIYDKIAPQFRKGG